MIKETNQDVIETTKHMIEHRVEWLINNLYQPVEDERLCFVADRKKLNKYGMGAEPINWGDLSVVDVMYKGNEVYEVLIEEAAPGECPNLCNYIEKYMQAWGFHVVVRTKW